MAPVNIRVTSTVKGLFFSGLYSVEDTNLTWRATLEKIGLRLNANDKYWISNASKKIKAVPENKVADFMKQFQHPMNPYIIYVSKTKAQTHADDSKKTKEANDKKSTEESQGLVTPVRSLFPRIVRRHNDDLGEGTSGPKRPRSGTTSFSEDGPGFPNKAESPEVVHDLTGDFDDAASMMSQDNQDSQDNGDDMKTSMVRQLMENISNEDLVVIKEEFLKMKADGKNTMTVARHIPTVVNFLDVLFANQPNAD